TPSSIFDDTLRMEEDFKRELLVRHGPENVHRLHDELADWMVRNVTVKRSNKDLLATLNKIKELKERYRHISLDDHSQFANQTYVFANEFDAMLELAMVITKGALLRNESRGAHYKVEFPQRDDENWLKTTIAKYDSQQEEPVISYESIELRYLKPTF